MKVKLAWFSLYNGTPELQRIIPASEDSDICSFRDSDEDYARLSDTVEVDIPMWGEPEQVASRVTSLNARIETKRTEREVEIQRLIEERQKLLAITNQSD